MTQYDERVELQRLKIEAEEWAGKVKSIHGHSINSMHYDTRPQDTEGGKGVVDVEYNDGTVERNLSEGGTYIFGKALTGQDLVNAYIRNT